MKPRFVLPGVLVIAAIVAIIAAGIASIALAAMPSLWPGRGTADTGFDPLFAGAACTPARAGPPPLLTHLVQAQAQPETRPFTPGQPASRPASPGQAAAAPPPLYSDLDTFHLPITTANHAVARARLAGQGTRTAIVCTAGDANGTA